MCPVAQSLLLPLYSSALSLSFSAVLIVLAALLCEYKLCFHKIGNGWMQLYKIWKKNKIVRKMRLVSFPFFTSYNLHSHYIHATHVVLNYDQLGNNFLWLLEVDVDANANSIKVLALFG